MQKKRKLMIAGIVVLLILILVIARYSRNRTSTQTAEGMAVPVAVTEVKRGEINKELVASGQIVGEQSVAVSPKISGRVASVNVELGAVVNAGDVLFSLDDTEIRAQVMQSQANVEVMEARKKSADQNRKYTARQFERYKQLYEQGAISAEAFETYRLKLEQAESEEPAALLAQARATLAYQLSILSNTVITSPINGEVAAKNVEVGNMVSPGAQSMLVVNLERVKVQVAVGEQHIGKLKQGQEVSVIVSAAREEPFTGVIASLSSAADPKTKSFYLEVKLENPDRVLKQGMFAEVHISIDHKENVLTVPVDAVLQRSGENLVYTVADGIARENRVEVGISNGKLAEITGGLNEGDQVIVLGQQGLVDGAKVTVAGGTPVQGISRKERNRIETS